MKITQKDIIDLILLSKTPSSDSKESKKRLAEISRDLSENGLEIEDYEQVRWIKFDPNDPKTFPPKNTVVLVMICKALSDGASKKMSVEVFNEYHMPNWLGGTFTHWRPLPPSPGKEEAK